MASNSFESTNDAVVHDLQTICRTTLAMEFYSMKWEILNLSLGGETLLDGTLHSSTFTTKGGCFKFCLHLHVADASNYVDPNYVGKHGDSLHSSSSRIKIIVSLCMLSTSLGRIQDYGAQTATTVRYNASNYARKDLRSVNFKYKMNPESEVVFEGILDFPFFDNNFSDLLVIETKVRIATNEVYRTKVH